MIDERPAAALAHLDRHLDQAQPVAEHHHRRLDLRIVVRVVAREERDALAVERLEAGRRVGDTAGRTIRETTQASSRMPRRRERDER